MSFLVCMCVCADSGKEGESSVCGAETQDPELQSALAYLSELQEKLNVYRLAGEQLNRFFFMTNYFLNHIFLCLVFSELRKYMV